MIEILVIFALLQDANTGTQESPLNAFTTETIIYVFPSEKEKLKKDPRNPPIISTGKGTILPITKGLTESVIVVIDDEKKEEKRPIAGLPGVKWNTKLSRITVTRDGEGGDVENDSDRVLAIYLDGASPRGWILTPGESVAIDAIGNQTLELVTSTGAGTRIDFATYQRAEPDPPATEDGFFWAPLDLSLPPVSFGLRTGLFWAPDFDFDYGRTAFSSEIGAPVRVRIDDDDIVGGYVGLIGDFNIARLTFEYRFAQGESEGTKQTFAFVDPVDIEWEYHSLGVNFDVPVFGYRFGQATAALLLGTGVAYTWVDVGDVKSATDISFDESESVWRWSFRALGNVRWRLGESFELGGEAGYNLDLRGGSSLSVGIDFRYRF